MDNNNFNNEDQAIVRAMDKMDETKSNLKAEILTLQLQNSILLNALKEIAIPYPEGMSAEQDKVLIEYFIALAQNAISKSGNEEVPELHPIFKKIVDNIYPPENKDL